MSGRTAMKGTDVPRHSRGERINHWIVAITFVLAVISGLALFHPAFWSLTALLGGGVWSRVLHPFLGVALFVFFGAMALRQWRDNLIQPCDWAWQKRLPDILNNRDEDLPEIDKYNMAQKQVFWMTVVTMILLLASGVVLWRDVTTFPVTVIRVAAVVHALAAFVLIIGIITHVYAATWVKGSVRAMTRGTVGRGWAKQHHPLWYRRVTGGEK